jgi:hypothetical protein
MQASNPEPVGNRIRAESQIEKLTTRDDTMLSTDQLP